MSLIPNIFTIQTVHGLEVCRTADILYFAFNAACRQWQLHTADGRTLPLSRLTKAQQICDLCPEFVQVRSNYIINLNYLVRIDNVTLECRLRTSLKVPSIRISRIYYRRFCEQLTLL